MRCADPWKGGSTLLIRYEDFTTKLMDDMDPVLLDFVKTKVTSFIKWDLLKLFHENPHTVDVANNLALYIGRSEAAVETDLQQMVESGLVEMRQTNGFFVFALTQDRETLALIERFLRACEDPQFRIKVVYHILRGMQ